LADYTRRLFTRLPAYASTRAKEMFPDAYRHNQELKVNYNLGLSFSVVLVTFALIIGLSVLTFRLAWGRAVGDIEKVAQQWEEGGDPEPAGVSSETGER
jgi:hypothetical protein